MSARDRRDGGIGRDAGWEKRPPCPHCGCETVWRNGSTSAGKTQYRCSKCERIFVVDPYLPALIVELADRMLKEDVPVPTIARIMVGKVSRRWLYNRKRTVHVND